MAKTLYFRPFIHCSKHKIFKVPRFRRACSQHNLTSSTPELPTQILTPCTTCEVISSSVHRNLCGEERSSLLHKLRKVQLSIRTRRQCSSSLGNNRAIYTRKDKTRLSLDASLIRCKLSRINGTLRRDLAETRLIEEQVLGAVLR